MKCAGNSMKELISSFINKYFAKEEIHIDPLAAELGLLKISEDQTDVSSSSSKMLQVLAGSLSAIDNFHFPPFLIGGCCPRIQGEEQDIVWNAAADACDTERVHIVWQSSGEKIFYLAVSSETMASETNSWCPFAALLPGMPDSAQPPVVYTYYSEETATMMTVTEDLIQIHRGTSSVIRAKAERASRENENAPIVELIPDHISTLRPAPWYSMSLFEEKARRILTTFSVLSALIIATIAVIIWFYSAMSMVSSNADLKSIEERSRVKSLALMKDVQKQRASPMREQLAKFADVNDGLISLNGFLEIYSINNNKVLWRAIVPKNVTSDRIKELGAQTLETVERGVIIGNSRKALTAGKSKRRGR